MTVRWGRVLATGTILGGLILAIGAGAIAWVLNKPGVIPERQKRIAELVARYGEVKYSQWAEELIIRDYFQDRREGFFLDVGAGDALHDSTTAYLELMLGWRGIAVEAEKKHKESYLRSRPGTRFFAFYAGDKDDAVVDFYVNPCWKLSSGSETWARDQKSGPPTQVPAITLNTLLAKEGVTAIDFLSMDIEQAEPLALAGFDIRRFRPQLVCIEVQGAVAARIEDYMRRNGYVEIERYRAYDLYNRYYTPGGDPAPAPAGTPAR